MAPVRGEGLAHLFELVVAEDLGQRGLVLLAQRVHGLPACLAGVERLLAQRLHVGVDRLAGLAQRLAIGIGDLPAVDQLVQALLHDLAALGAVLFLQVAARLGQGLALLVVEDLVHALVVRFTKLLEGLAVFPAGRFQRLARRVVDAGPFIEGLAALLMLLMMWRMIAVVGALLGAAPAESARGRWRRRAGRGPAGYG